MELHLTCVGRVWRKIMRKPNNFQRIRELNYLQKAVLACALMERMLPNYDLFSEATGFGDATALRNALNVCWEKILHPKSKISLEKQVEKVEPNVPELADFDMFGVYPAIDVATALLTLLHGLMAKDELEFVNVSKISQGTVARMVEYQFTCDDTEFDNQMVREHPLMQYEIEVLGELVDFVEKMGRIENDSVKGLKELALADGQTNIGLEL